MRLLLVRSAFRRWFLVLLHKLEDIPKVFFYFRRYVLRQYAPRQLFLQISSTLRNDAICRSRDSSETVPPVAVAISQEFRDSRGLIARLDLFVARIFFTDSYRYTFYMYAQARTIDLLPGPSHS